MSKALEGEHLCLKHQGNHSHYAEHNCTICVLQAEIAKLKEQLKAQGEPVAFIYDMETVKIVPYKEINKCKTGDKLYAAPPIPDDKVMVPKPDTISEFDGGSLRGFCIGIYYHEREKFELAYKAMIEAAKEG